MADFETAAAAGRFTDTGQSLTEQDAADQDTLEVRVRSLRLPPASSRRSGAVGWVAAVVGVLVIAGGAALGYWLYERSAKETGPQIAAAAPIPAPAASDAPAADAAAKKPAAAPGPQDGIALESKGYIIAAHQILVSPKVSGMIVYLNIEEGRLMKQGEVLARIESVEYQSDRDTAAATLELARQQLRELEHGNRPEEIEEAEADLGEAQAQLVDYASDWKRKRELRGTGVLTAQELEAAESQYHATEKRVERLKAALKLMRLGPREERIAAARAEVRQHEAELLKANWRLDNCSVRAPISGTILKKNAEEGNIVDAHFFSGSASLCEMADLSDLEVDLTIQERDIARISVGQKCQVRAEAYPNRVYQGVVSRLMPIADRAKGAVPVRVKVSVPADETGVYLKPEMGAIVTFFK